MVIFTALSLCFRNKNKACWMLHLLVFLFLKGNIIVKSAGTQWLIRNTTRNELTCGIFTHFQYACKESSDEPVHFHFVRAFAVPNHRNCSRQTLRPFRNKDFIFFRLRLFTHTLNSVLQSAYQNFFSYFSTKTYVVGTERNRLDETVLLNTQNIC